MSLEDEKESEEVRKDLTQFSKGSVKKEFQVGKWVFSLLPTSQQHQILPAPALPWNPPRGTNSGNSAPKSPSLAIWLWRLARNSLFFICGKGMDPSGWPLLCSGGGTSTGIPWEGGRDEQSPPQPALNPTASRDIPVKPHSWGSFPGKQPFWNQFWCHFGVKMAILLIL